MMPPESRIFFFNMSLVFEQPSFLGIASLCFYSDSSSIYFLAEVFPEAIAAAWSSTWARRRS